MRIVLSAAPVFLSALLFLSAALKLLFLASSPHWPEGPSTAQSYLPGNNILHICIFHAQVIKMGVTPSSLN